MNGSTIASSERITFAGIAVTPDATWCAVEIGDFNGDGSSDVLWRNNNGAMAEWLMNGNEIMQSVTPNHGGAAVSPDATWTTQVEADKLRLSGAKQDRLQTRGPSRQAAVFAFADVRFGVLAGSPGRRSSQTCHAVLVLLFDGFAIQPVNHVSKPAGRAVDGFKAVTRTIIRLVRNGMLDELLSDGATK